MTTSDHLSLIRAIEDMARAQRDTGAWLSRELGCGRGGITVVRLLGSGPRQVGELAHLLRVDVSVASRQVAALVDAGLVERDVPADDRRLRTVALTDAGRRFAARATEATLGLAAAVFADWSPAELDEATGQIRKVASAIADHHGATAGTAGTTADAASRPGPSPARPSPTRTAPTHPHRTATSPEREIA
ncbi:MarR family transcriptional regulator [Cellulomonas sp. ATA003]|uniref:MarR family winged helix-turn-helix transcriptional regulator n=1 Tax=Cellulomonas sp. ATA003 TaxID=3073064 RepID=UPI0028731A2D|nr:MarR family transcriptional regulator [Cellulomonas sp. ATA003]WNB85362.1 MarR family transcriptional regulator [Cellulomonas sp. ATA003]